MRDALDTLKSLLASCESSEALSPSLADWHKGRIDGLKLAIRLIEYPDEGIDETMVALNAEMMP